ncbi:hypothetical protein HYW87_04435, partial [Candidatus Roizmanbacteria bacterium]|nr:hypothetical protein [Candidatus Roizmanbacteria bacterium]
MKNLEKKIVKKIYAFETKRTITEIVIELFGLLLLGFLIFIFISVIVDQFIEEETLDTFQLLREDIEVVQKYFVDVLSTLYYETPRLQLVILLFVVGIFGVLI